jgi:cytoskeletal protein RodZ
MSTLPSNVSQFETSPNKPPPKRDRPGMGGLVITLILVVILIGVIAVAVTRLSGGALTRPGPTTAPTQVTSATKPSTAATAAPEGTPADAGTTQAIQQVIQQVDQAQIQAIQSNNPQVMAPTATPEFYQEQVASNQDLVDAGVTEIKLLNIEWGPISVNGNMATATVWETWSTTFEDGTTEQSRDRNVYTLVMDNGAWKVQADDHPDQGTGQGQGGQGPAGAP